jgi:hypothetical protein
MIRKAIVSSLLRVHARAARTPYYDIWDHGNCYMVRDWVWGGRSPERNTDNPNWKVEGFTAPKSSAFYRWLCRHIVARAHTILRSDQDRHLHDHPAWSISIVLAGGYWEITQPPLLAEVAKPLYRGTVETIEQGWICAPSADHEFLQVFAHMGIYQVPLCSGARATFIGSCCRKEPPLNLSGSSGRSRSIGDFWSTA